MTLLVIAQNDKFTVQVSDQRLTNNGELVDDGQEKCFTLQTADARVCVSFTGIARVQGTIETYRWLIETFVRAKSEYFTLDGFIDNFVDLANKKFSNSMVLRRLHEASLLIIVFGGYHYGYDPPLPIGGIITNGQEDGSIGPFHVQRWFKDLGSSEPFHVLYTFGTTAGIDPVGMNRVVQMLHRRRTTSEAVSNVLKNEVRKAARHKLSYGVVGEQLNSIAIPSDPDKAPLVEMDTAKALNRWALPGAVLVDHDGCFAMGSLFFEGHAGAPPIRLPRARRNDPCPCGSKSRYSKCCGAKRTTASAPWITYRREPGNHIVIDIGDGTVPPDFDNSSTEWR